MGARKMVAFFSERNMVRSIIAEAYMKRHGQEFFDSISFGIRPNRIHYLVYDVLKSRGFNLNYYFSKRYEVVERQPVDMVIIMHPDLEEKLPPLPNSVEKIIWNFDDPTVNSSNEEEMRKAIHALCDAIEKKVKEFIETHKNVVVEK